MLEMCYLSCFFHLRFFTRRLQNNEHIYTDNGVEKAPKFLKSKG